ncbi:uncharacterized protein MELLADRAFT_114066 [Melampsora larici-populina 98AG31]|uniref:Uncharacterized protein n=1 Tax=Melampsora larici-populina (strain 98AG31 / pathotype 3-4-7) TaxID=747676 RepID=F4SC20_MELLP|nr:uncharacterized protein MELLADRAFT_114066 [Melampsora larici-populina 98AG31]EGF97812.1 hypothetical protein MELLADRAFT_114066 [Melampsora larici-populina 98AG31]
MVKRTLDSAAGTSRDTLEVIVIEDGSDKDECEKDESDKNEKIIVIEDESKNNEEIIIIEDESKKDETKKQTKKGCGKTPQKDVIKSCPLSKPNAPCTLCKTNDTVSQKTLYCHCGSKIVLRKGRVEAAVDHWANDKCKKKTNTICANASLTSWVTTTTVKKNAVTKPCAGLNDDTWKRPTAKLRIENCIKHSPTPYHGVKRWKVCFQLFKTTHEVSLSDEQRKQFHAALESQATWIIKRHGAQESIHSPRCTRTVMTTAKTLYPLCDDCEAISPRALRLFNDNFAGRGARSMRQIRKVQDVSTCMAEKYDVVYKNGPEDPLEEAVTTAAEAIDEQQQTDVLLSAIPEDIDEVIFKNVAMSLSTILNPNEGGSSEARSEGTLSDLAGIDHKLNTLILNNQEGINLEKSKLLQLRVAHDSQVQRHRGNERAKINVDDLRKSPGELLKPSECSKLVAVVMKKAEATPTGLSRIHRWSINVKLNLLQRFQNTSTHLDSSSHADLTGGGITAHNPIEMGKFVVLIKNGVSTT